MELFSFLSGKKKINGLVQYFNLEDWWSSELTEEEQQHILETFKPMGSSEESLISGNISYTSQTAVGLLQSLAGWFAKEKDRPIAHKLLAKAEDLLKNGDDVLDAHFLYGQKLEIYYKDRESEYFLEKAIDACNQQISLAQKAAPAFRREYKDSPLPGHKGYQQLAIILEKQEKFDETIALCEQAMTQGWSGDWEKRIERSRRKRSKALRATVTSTQE